MDKVLIAVLTSFFASILFWIFFEWLPRRKEKKRIKPLIDFDLYQLKGKLFFLIETPFRMFKHSPSYMQDSIKNGSLTEIDFKRYLSTKCLTEEYHKNDEYAKKLIPIGKELNEKTEEIVKDIQRLYIFNYYLTSDQIILLRKIADILKTYDYNLPASIEVGKSVFVHENPTMKHYFHLFYPLYKSYLKLQKYLENQHGTDTEFGNFYTELFRNRVSRLMLEENYKYFLKRTRQSKDSFFLPQRFLAYFYLNQQEDMISSLELFLRTSTLRLISLRGTFSHNYDNPIIKDNLIRLRGELEYYKMVKCIEEELNNRQLIESFVDEMYEYYEKRSSIHSKESNQKYIAIPLLDSFTSD